MELIERYLETIKRKSVNKPGSSCLLWSGSLSQSGYPYMKLKWKVVYVHRVLWEYHHGKLTSESAVAKKCKVKSCVNIAHFYLKKSRNPNPFKEYNESRKRK